MCLCPAGGAAGDEGPVCGSDQRKHWRGGPEGADDLGAAQSAGPAAGKCSVQILDQSFICMLFFCFVFNLTHSDLAAKKQKIYFLWLLLRGFMNGLKKLLPVLLPFYLLFLFIFI